MATLLLAEVAGGNLSDMTARALTAALEISQPVDVLVAGAGRRAARPRPPPSFRASARCWSPTTRPTRTGSPSRSRR